MPTRKDDEKQDRAVEDSFPASDPPANSGITPPAPRPEVREGGDESGPKGMPTSERPATEPG